MHGARRQGISLRVFNYTLTRDLPSSNEHQEIKSEKQENKNKNG